jgi:hypothetical protein
MTRLNMNTNVEKENLAEAVALFSALADLYRWEVDRSSIFTNATGRHLYYTVGQRCIVSGMCPTIKEVINATHLTDRGLRIRLSDLVKNGYLISENGVLDSRTKSLYMGDSFEKMIFEHLAQFKKILNSNFC